MFFDKRVRSPMSSTAITLKFKMSRLLEKRKKKKKKKKLGKQTETFIGRS